MTGQNAVSEIRFTARPLCENRPPGPSTGRNDQEDFMPFYSVEIAYPDEREDTWRLKMQLNAASQENEITIEVE